MHIVCIQLIIIINHLLFLLLVETKSYTNMCFSNEPIVGKPPPFTPDSTKLTIGELEDNCDYIDIEDRIKLSCDNRSLSLIQLNIRGLLSKSSALNLLLTENIGNIKPNMVLLCETWLNPNNLAKVDIPNYRLFGNVRSNKLGGGTGILVHKTLRSRIRKDLEIDTKTVEDTVIEIKTETTNLLVSIWLQASKQQHQRILI